jgi:CheY-like chemotaxis protein
VYGIVKQHEGSIDVASQVGVGTTFTIYLPAARAREETASEMTEEIPTGQGETILLVEDEAVVLDVIQAMLEQLRYRVLTATNGREALIVYEQYHDEIDLVLMDLIMPEMDGEALLQALRARDPRVKVVAMTGYPLGGKYRQLLTQEVIDRIQKPMDHAQLAQVLRQTLG